MKAVIWHLSLFLVCHYGIYGIDAYDAQLHSYHFDIDSREPLFVSLGSSCEIAHHLRALDLRRAAFPFDWILSVDNMGLLALLEDDFSDYFNPAYLEPHDNGTLLHTLYKLVYPHDGKWGDEARREELLTAFTTKYQRRIKRWRSLNRYKGKIFFCRAAYPYATTGSYYRDPSNLVISDQWALIFYDALKREFPDADFHLVIINTHKEDRPMEVRHVQSDITIIESNLYLHGEENKRVQCKEIYIELLKEQGLTASQTWKEIATSS